MRYYQKYQNWVINENNAEHIQIANNNIAIAKSSESPNQIGSKIGNALGRLDKIDPSTLSDEEKSKFIIAFDEINKIVTNNDTEALLKKAKRQKRFDKIGEMMPDLKGDLDDAQKEETTKELKQEQIDDPNPQAGKQESDESDEPKEAISIQNDATKETETVKNSIKANIQTGKQISNSSKLPQLSQKLSGKATPDEVKFVQAFLKSKGYLGKTSEAVALGTNDADIDGNYGPGTAGAVASYQKNKAMKDDGIVGTKTWNSILKDLGHKAANVTAIQFDEYEKVKGNEVTPPTAEPKEYSEAPKKDDAKPKSPQEMAEDPSIHQQQDNQEEPKDPSEIDPPDTTMETDDIKKQKNDPKKPTIEKPKKTLQKKRRT